MTPDGRRPHPPACTRKQQSSALAAPVTRPASRSTVPWCWHRTSMPAPRQRRRGEDSRAYSRTDATPTWEALETAVGQVEGGHAVAFSSGMAAVAAVLDLVPPEQHRRPGRLLLRGRRASGRRPAARALGRRPRRPDRHRQRPGRRRRRGPAVAGDPLQPAARGGRPSRPVRRRRRAGAIVGVDNTFATPLLQQPLALGADIVVHSATKFIGGHSDLLSGITIARDQALAGRLRHRRGLAGATPGALEAFLALRGLRTLALRLDRGQHNASELARRLDQHPAVRRVRYPGLPADPGHQTAAAQMTGFGAVLAFEVTDAPTADRLCDALHVIVHATSLGGIESTIERRSKLPGQEHVPPGLLRLSVGCEHIDDLWNDLSTALQQATRPDNPA